MSGKTTAAALILLFLACAAVMAIIWPISEHLQSSNYAIVRVFGALLGTIGIIVALTCICGLVAHLLDHRND